MRRIRKMRDVSSTLLSALLSALLLRYHLADSGERRNRALRFLFFFFLISSFCIRPCSAMTVHFGFRTRSVCLNCHGRVMKLRNKVIFPLMLVAHAFPLRSLQFAPAYDSYICIRQETGLHVRAIYIKIRETPHSLQFGSLIATSHMTPDTSMFSGSLRPHSGHVKFAER